ncbi:MFS transporter [Kiloniella sp. b19]|uniref:MFS transporter n=1 Tax=Kiloniella sp. GXU_MW_B19 TaxID=3141326 RepID=UPI0031D485B6
MLNLRISSYYAAVFLVMGIYLPFWPLWLEEQGLDAETIGLLMALAPWLQIFTSPGLALIADKTGRHRKTLIAIALFAALSFYGIYHAEALSGLTSLPKLTLFFILQAAAICTYLSMIPIGDSQTLKLVNRHDLSYGRLRMWGSISFIAASVVIGKLLEVFSNQATIWLMIGALILAAFAASVLPRVRDRLPVPAKTEEEKSEQRSALKILLGRPRFLLVIFAASSITASHATFYAFGSLYMSSLGYDESAIGLVWAVGVVAEVLLLYNGKRILKLLKPAHLILLGGCGAALRWFLMTELDNIWFFGLLQCLHMLSFATTHLGIASYLSHNAPEKLAASSQSLYSGLANGLMMGVGMLIAGSLFPVNPQWAFWVSGALASTGILLMLTQRSLLALTRETGQAAN